MQYPEPQNFTLSPFGTGRVLEALHHGKLFNVYRAEVCGQEVCLKTPALDSARDGYYQSAAYEFAGSEYFSGGNTGTDIWDIKNVTSCTQSDRSQIASNFLLAEAQIIQWTEGAWNHTVLGQGTWDGLSTYHKRSDHSEPLAARFLPVLVMPFHRAIPFSRLPSQQKRKLFPQMLPALWTALSQMYHGDLSEANILMQPNYDKFHLIDPGVILSSQIAGTTDRSVLQDDSYLSLFVTNAENYPLLPPFEDANLAKYDESDRSEGLISYVHSLVDLIRVESNDDSYVRYWWKKPDMDSGTLGIYSLYSRSQGKLQPVTHSQPLPSDLLALGIIYFRILTGKELFLGQDILPEKPAWQGELPSMEFTVIRVNEIYNAYAKAFKMLSSGYLEKELTRHSLSPGERNLASALLHLKVHNREHLLRLTNSTF